MVILVSNTLNQWLRKSGIFQWPNNNPIAGSGSRFIRLSKDPMFVLGNKFEFLSDSRSDGRMAWKIYDRNCKLERSLENNRRCRSWPRIDGR